MRIALIDLGTASLRFEIYEIVAPTSPDSNRKYILERIYRKRYMPRLGQGLYASGLLDDSAKQYTLSLAADIKSLLRQYEASKTLAVATSAFREAKDADSFVEQLHDAFGFNFEVLSGAQEASLIARGINANEPGLENTYVLVDIGGGNTEISICSDGITEFSISLQLGSLRAQQMFFVSAESAEQASCAFRQHIKDEIKAIRELNAYPPLRCIWGSSGTIRSLCELDWGIARDNEGFLSAADLKRIISRLEGMSTEEIAAIKDMPRNRADIILPGSILFDEIVGFFEAAELRASLYSLRHGVLDQALETLLQ